MMRFWLFLLVMLASLPGPFFSTTLCHPKCQCLWRKNKQIADCSSAGFERIPSSLSPSTQILNLTQNSLHLLPPNAFLSSGLVHLQKLYLVKCEIEQIDGFALNRVSNLIELDLSDNLLSSVPTAAFRHLPLLRHLILNGNPLGILPSQAFIELKTLIILEISSCKIDTIASQAFEGLQKLEVLKMDNNQLKTLSQHVMGPLASLHGITLDGNPWTCDCELRELRLWLHNNNVPYIPPTCFQPFRLHNQLWSAVDLDEYACSPTFLNTSSAINVLEGSNVTLECRVSGDPIPSIQWLWRGRVLSNFSEGISSMQTFIMSEYVGKEKHSKLRISSVQEPNGGVYTCIASNTADTVSKNFTLMVSRVPLTDIKIIKVEKTQEIKGEEQNSVTGMAIGIALGIIIVLLIMVFGPFVCYRHVWRNKPRKRIGTNHKVAHSVNPPSPNHSLSNLENKLHNLSPSSQGHSTVDPVWKISDHHLPWDELPRAGTMNPWQASSSPEALYAENAGPDLIDQTPAEDWMCCQREQKNTATQV